MTTYKLAWIIFISQITLTSSSAGNLFPYGVAAGDQAATKTDDACQHSYQQGLSMFGNNYTRLYVCTNGAISLDKIYKKFIPTAFPLTDTDKAPLICPYWADTDIRKGGDVFSRISNDSTLLARASAEVRDGFRTGTDATFSAKWMLIATWAEVRAFARGGQTDINRHKLNTFQAVIVSDGLAAFAFFLYDKIQWSVGGASKGVAAQVGFDAGDGAHFYNTSNSRTPAIVNIASESNVGIPGRMIFKLGSATPQIEDTTNENGTVVEISTAGIVLPDKPTPTTTPVTPEDWTTTTDTSTASSSITTTAVTTPTTTLEPIRVVMTNEDVKSSNDMTAIIAASIAVLLSLLAAIIAISFIVRRRKLQLEERRRKQNEIRKFSYFPTESEY